MRAVRRRGQRRLFDRAQLRVVLDRLVRGLGALDELGLPGVGLVGLPALEPATEDFGHRGEVVGALDGLDLEAAVLGLRRLAVDEHDHAGDRARALDVRVVVALDATRVGRQVELFLQLRQGLVALGGVAEPAHV